MNDDKIISLLKSNPLLFVLQSADPNGSCPINWNRYLPFLRHGHSWVPFHKTYSALWAARKWGCNYHWKETDHFIMDLTDGKIVWNDWETANE